MMGERLALAPPSELPRWSRALPTWAAPRTAERAWSEVGPGGVCGELELARVGLA